MERRNSSLSREHPWKGLLQVILMAYQVKDYPYNDKLSTEENLLLDRLYKLRMSGMAEALEKQLLDPNADLEPFTVRITEIIGFEWEQRRDKKLKKLIRDATLKYPNADLDESLYEPDRKIDVHTVELLSRCEWIDAARNLLITGDAGVGKTYIANALCLSAIHQLRSVRYIRATPLINEAIKACSLGQEMEYINKMAAYDLLAVDDFGLMDLDMEKCRLLFEILETRDCRKSTLIISQMPVAKWWELFKDSTYADACLSRITHKAHRLELKGRDMRITGS